VLTSGVDVVWQDPAQAAPGPGSEGGGRQRGQGVEDLSVVTEDHNGCCLCFVLHWTDNTRQAGTRGLSRLGVARLAWSTGQGDVGVFGRPLLQTFQLLKGVHRQKEGVQIHGDMPWSHKAISTEGLEDNVCDTCTAQHSLDDITPSRLLRTESVPNITHSQLTTLHNHSMLTSSLHIATSHHHFISPHHSTQQKKLISRGQSVGFYFGNDCQQARRITRYGA